MEFRNAEKNDLEKVFRLYKSVVGTPFCVWVAVVGVGPFGAEGGHLHGEPAGKNGERPVAQPRLQTAAVGKDCLFLSGSSSSSLASVRCVFKSAEE